VGGQTGLEPEYDCPDCGFHESGLTKSPQDYLQHLQKGARIRRQRSNGDSQRLTPTRRRRHPTRRPPVRARRDTPPRRATRRASARPSRGVASRRGRRSPQPPKRLDGHLAVVRLNKRYVTPPLEAPSVLQRVASVFPPRWNRRACALRSATTGHRARSRRRRRRRSHS